MIKISKVEIHGWEAAIRGMRNPLESWDKSDTGYCDDYMCTPENCRLYNINNKCGEIESGGVVIGANDMELMMGLSKAGTDHSKYLRMVTVTLDIEASHTFWQEFDTYKVGTVRNSCSKMHRIHVHEFTPDMFDHEGIDAVGGNVKKHFEDTIKVLNYLRDMFNSSQDMFFWRALIELLPMGFHLKATVLLNYQVLKAMYHSRKNHKLIEWRTFCGWIESLPYSEIITGKEE